MFVRCPVDEDLDYPRDYAIGKVKSIDEFNELVEVQFFDVTGVSVFYPKPKDQEFRLDSINHLKVKIGAKVLYQNSHYLVKALNKNKEDDLYYYYLQSQNDEIVFVPETELSVSYNDGYVWPLEQMKKFEFQNPMWFLGRSVVSKTMHIINNSMYGFNEIAGCKIFLKTHQLKTVIRCLQFEKCRNMIADEVGMGKTIEALSVLKVFLKDHHNCNILIIVPDSLISQWRTELAYKFKILEGEDINYNYIELASVEEIVNYDQDKYDFVIADEVHKYLADEHLYDSLLKISKNAENILMLSATPVQRRKDEYKKLLTLIQPEKYEKISNKDFECLLEQQNDIVRRVYSALEELDSYNDEIEDASGERTEDIEESFEEVLDSIKMIKVLIKDSTFESLCNEIDLESEDFGVSAIQAALSYVCENYQFEKSIIRNRKQSIDDDDYNKRELIDISYDMQTNFNNTEYNVYSVLAEWIESKSIDYEAFNNKYKKIISSCFSSAAAFKNEIEKVSDEIPDELLIYAQKWVEEEDALIEKMEGIMEDPTDCESRLINIIDYIDQEAYGKKVLLFTNFDKTFEQYRKVLDGYFGSDHCAYFSKHLDSEERELSAYRFETDNQYDILLCDESGGEGRNFQNADLVIHIDIPWSANDLEQRIGRLDRIGREKGKPVVSIVAYAKLSLEEDLFNFWNDGIGIFTRSQSGLEIIMNDMDEKIVQSVCEDFKYGLNNIVTDVEKEINDLKETITRERYFDVAEYKYQNLNKIMDRTREMYSQNEKELFADAMLGWSSLSGFRGTRIADSIIKFDASSFSIKSAYNSLFIPPDIKLLISDKINQIQNRVRMLNSERLMHEDTNYVQGTFDRNLAIKNDYIHFFAPGDEIFDSIVKNALGSYKGTCAAFACFSEIDWMGIIVTWALYPDESYLYKNGLSSHTIDKYRGFMPVEQLQCAISLRSNEKQTEENVLKVYNKLLHSEKADKRSIQHLGKRSGVNPSIKAFMEAWPDEKWKQAVEYGYSKSLDKVKNMYEELLKKQLKLLKSELISNASAKKATGEYYGQNKLVDDETLNDIIYECFAHPRVVLDSVCYVRFISNER